MKTSKRVELALPIREGRELSILSARDRTLYATTVPTRAAAICLGALCLAAPQLGRADSAELPGGPPGREGSIAVGAETGLVVPVSTNRLCPCRLCVSRRSRLGRRGQLLLPMGERDRPGVRVRVLAPHSERCLRNHGAADVSPGCSSTPSCQTMRHTRCCAFEGGFLMLGPLLSRGHHWGDGRDRGRG